MSLASRPEKSPAILIVMGCSIATAALGGGAGLWWWRKSAGQQPHPSRSIGTGAGQLPDGGVTIVISGDTAGWIVPCGCTSNQSGGLPRRSAFIAERRQAGTVIVADAGGAPGGTSLYDRARFEAILDGELAQGVAAHNLGEPEVALGIDYLQTLAREKQVPFVSANLHDSAGHRPFEACRIVEAGGVRVALIGVVKVYSGAGSRKDFNVDDPRSAILAALAEAAGKFDRAVVLAHVREDDLRSLAAELPEVDAVIGGPTGQSIPPQLAGQTIVASATNKGKFVISMTLTAARRPADLPARVVELSDKFPDDPAQLELVRAFRKELGRRDFGATETGLAPRVSGRLPPGSEFAGSSSCLACHKEEHGDWGSSQHARAWETLVADSVHVDPACQVCHTTGYGLPGGFQSLARSEARVAVGCESCHGPSRAHVDRPKQRTPFGAREQCRQCHDHENSPQFEFDDYWRKIAHGGGKHEN
jgi:Cytochrome c554 and c-prime